MIEMKILFRILLGFLWIAIENRQSKINNSYDSITPVNDRFKFEVYKPPLGANQGHVLWAWIFAISEALLSSCSPAKVDFLCRDSVLL
jgi:hypothetical protein